MNISIENFLAFKNKATFDFKPITVFVGPNNSGKSSAVSGFKIIHENNKFFDQVEEIYNFKSINYKGENPYQMLSANLFVNTFALYLNHALKRKFETETNLKNKLSTSNKIVVEYLYNVDFTNEYYDNGDFVNVNDRIPKQKPIKLSWSYDLISKEDKTTFIDTELNVVIVEIKNRNSHKGLNCDLVINWNILYTYKNSFSNKFSYLDYFDNINTAFEVGIKVYNEKNKKIISANTFKDVICKYYECKQLNSEIKIKFIQLFLNIISENKLLIDGLLVYDFWHYFHIYISAKKHKLEHKSTHQYYQDFKIVESNIKFKQFFMEIFDVIHKITDEDAIAKSSGLPIDDEEEDDSINYINVTDYNNWFHDIMGMSKDSLITPIKFLNRITNVDSLIKFAKKCTFIEKSQHYTATAYSIFDDNSLSKSISLYNGLNNTNKAKCWAKVKQHFCNTLQICDDIKEPKFFTNDYFKIEIVKNGALYNLNSLGLGSLQLLPLLINIFKEYDYNESWSGKALKRNDTVFIEEPESNLHPNYQSKLADIFVDAINYNKNINIVIETHSEYLIRRLQLLTNKNVDKILKDGNTNKLKPEDTVIYYFNDPNNIPDGQEQVYPIHINDNGTLTRNFGTGFFDEADNIALELFLLNQSQKN